MSSQLYYNEDSSHSPSPCYYIGTNSAKQNNEIHHVQYNQSNNTISLINIYEHSHMIFYICSAPHNAQSIVTVYYNSFARKYQATVWQCMHNSNTNTHQLERLLDLPHISGCKITGIRFNTYNDNSNELLVCDEQSVHLYKFTDSSCTTIDDDNGYTAMPNVSSDTYATACAFNPHQPDSVAIAYNNNTINLYNTPNKKIQCTITLNTTLQNSIKYIDFNPNKSNTIICGGTDRLIHMIDIRYNSVVSTLSNHSHWIWQCKYNRIYDQLILSAGTDIINLWSITSGSSAATVDSDDSGHSSAPVTDRLIDSYTIDHTDSIYCVEWSGNDPFIFASLSYDGRFIIHHVRQDEKYKLLL